MGKRCGTCRVMRMSLRQNGVLLVLVLIRLLIFLDIPDAILSTLLDIKPRQFLCNLDLIFFVSIGNVNVVLSPSVVHTCHSLT
jgi:hypothetical protein